jgi:hypothetical protein
MAVILERSEEESLYFGEAPKYSPARAFSSKM